MSGFLVNVLNSAPILGIFTGNGFRPPSWTQPQLTSISVNLPGEQGTAVNTVIRDSSGNVISTSGTRSVPSPQPTTYFFDAIMRAEHSRSLRATEHPVQSGASIVDHAYMLAARLELEIGMSDVMDSFEDGQWTSYSSKSVSAYQTLLYLQSLRVPLTVTTRLNIYENMIIEHIRSGDDIRTLHGLQVSVQFREIIVGKITVNTISARSQQTQASTPGTAQPEPLPPAVQNKVNAIDAWAKDHGVL